MLPIPVKNKRRVVYQLLIPVFVSIILLLTGYAYTIRHVKRLLINERKRESKEMVYSIYSLINKYYKMSLEDSITELEAKETIKLIIKNLKYGEELKDYFWLLDYNNQIISHPYFNDSLRIARMLPKQKLALNYIVTAVKNKEENFVFYDWQWKDDTTRIEEKISFAKKFKPWGWIIGTGFYKKEVDSEIKVIIRYTLISILIVVSIIVILLLFILGKAFDNIRSIIDKEKKLVESEIRFEGMANNISSGLIIKEDEKVVFANKSIGEIFDINELELESFSLIDFVVEEEFERIQLIMEGLKGNNTSIDEIECWVHSKKYERKFLSCHISYERREGKLYTYILINDYTEKKRNETKIKSLSATLSQVPDSIVITDLIGNIIYVNQQFEINTGYTFNDVFGKNPRILKSDKMPSAIYSNLWETITSGNIWKGELLNRKKSGELFWENTIIFPVKNDRGEILNYAAIKTDLTKEKFLEKELSHFKEMAKVSDNLKIAFLNNISHEVRTPLNAIFGFSQILKEGLKENTSKTDLVHTIQKNAEILLSLFEDIIDYSIIEAGDIKIEKEEFQIYSFIGKIISKFNTELITQQNKEIEIILCSNSNFDQAILTADRNWLTKVFENILSNAIKFTIRGTIRVGYSINYENIIFYIQDTGVGIPASESEQIFEKFTHGKNLFVSLHKGTGLGLNISNRILEIMGGKLWFSSEENVGTTFHFSLPSIDVKNYSIGSVKVTDFPYINMLNNKRIIIAEDNDEYFSYIKSLLAGNSTEITRVRNTMELLGLFGTKKYGYDIIIIEMVLSYFDGLNSIHAIKSINSSIPIILLIDDESEASEAEMQLYRAILKKPFSKNTLYKTIHDLI